MNYYAQLDTQLIACPACESRELKHTYRQGKYRIGSCKGCGLWMLNPQPSIRALDQYYAQTYYSNAEWVKAVPRDVVMHQAEGKIAAYQQVLERLRTEAPGGRILDVGCAFGQFVLTANEMGFEAAGVELSSSLAARAREFGLKVQTGDVLSADLGRQGYDAVTAWYVLEHVADPVVFLQRCHALLVEKGVLVLRVPNMLFGLPFLWLGALGLHVEPSILSHIPAHLFFFTPHTLSRLVEAAGFSHVRIENGLPILAPGKDRRTLWANRLRRTSAGTADIVARVLGHRAVVGPFMTLYARR